MHYNYVFNLPNRVNITIYGVWVYGNPAESLKSKNRKKANKKQPLKPDFI